MRRHITLVAVLAVCAACLLLTFVRRQGGYLSFEDAQTYVTAFGAWFSHGNPYQQTNGLNFVYPPIFLYVGGWFIQLLTLPAVKLLYVVFHVISAMVLPWVLYRYYLRDSAWSLELFFVVYFLAPGLAFFLSLDTGNIAVMAWTAMLLAGAPGLEKNRWFLFYVMVFICASIKITYLPMLLLPLLCAATNQLVPSLVTAVLASAGLQAQGWLSPALFRGFKQNLSYQTVALGDVGAGIFGISYHALSKLHHPTMLLPLIAYGLVALGCVGTATIIKLNSRAMELPSSWPAIILLVIFFAIPRVEYYDLCFGCPVAIFLMAARRRFYSLLIIYLAVALPALYFRMRMPYTAPDGGYQTIATLVLLAILLIRIHATRRVETEPAEESTISPETVA